MSTAIERISIDAPYGSDMVADARPRRARLAVRPAH
jgi:hypothetical protein